jgi:hypothetical protein
MPSTLELNTFTRSLSAQPAEHTAHTQLLTQIRPVHKRTANSFGGRAEMSGRGQASKDGTLRIRRHSSPGGGRSWAPRRCDARSRCTGRRGAHEHRAVTQPSPQGSLSVVTVVGDGRPCRQARGATVDRTERGSRSLRRGHDRVRQRRTRREDRLGPHDGTGGEPHVEFEIGTAQERVHREPVDRIHT